MTCKRLLAFSGVTNAVLFAAACSSSHLTPAVPVNASTVPFSHSSGNVSESILHSFGGADGAGPAFGVIRDKAGAFYGTTIFGGASNGGTVFRLKPQSGGYREDVLHSFGGGVDGFGPFGGLVADRAGALYGTTLEGGVSGGTVFKLTPSGSGFTKKTLYLFGSRPDVSGPIGTLVMDPKGNFFGAAQSGGTASLGGVFELSPSGSRYKESVLYSFHGGADGYVPQGGVAIDRAGNIFGTAWGGGDLTKCEQAGCGLVFQLTRSGGRFTESVAYNFQGSPTDGSHPQGTLTVDNRTGEVYGTTPLGGINGGGVIFKLTPSGSTYGETVLHSLKYPTEGELPQGAVLVKPDGTVFGTAEFGGSGCHGTGCGTVFKIVPSGSTYDFRVLLDFANPRGGADPENTTLVTDATGALYGTTRSGEDELRRRRSGRRQGLRCCV